jgi:hypothetical protein
LFFDGFGISLKKTVVWFHMIEKIATPSLSQAQGKNKPRIKQKTLATTKTKTNAAKQS